MTLKIAWMPTATNSYRRPLGHRIDARVRLCFAKINDTLRKWGALRDPTATSRRLSDASWGITLFISRLFTSRVLGRADLMERSSAHKYFPLAGGPGEEALMAEGVDNLGQRCSGKFPKTPLTMLIVALWRFFSTKANSFLKFAGRKLRTFSSII